MWIIIITIVVLFFLRRKFTIPNLIIDRTLIFLSIWLVLGLTLRIFLVEKSNRTHTDIEMAQTFIKDNPVLCRKAETTILDDGTVKIIPKKGKSLYLKDGVITSWR
jgi:hypothetical protein